MDTFSTPEFLRAPSLPLASPFQVPEELRSHRPRELTSATLAGTVYEDRDK
jgi:hypothetical protein